jgi:imidazoleglycerol-phosphate dehydratase
VAAREATVARRTGETDVRVRVALDGTGLAAVRTGVGFFDHMLAALARTALIDLEASCTGDLQVDAHHTVEDVGLALGRALREAWGDRHGLRRYGWALAPMDEALARVAVDLSGRPHLSWEADLPPQPLGAFTPDLAEEFWRAAAAQGAFTLHVDLLRARSAHHGLEAVHKAAGLALRQAIEVEPRIRGVLSTKGTLD